ncbi:MAG: Zn-ribbon domain-containing OB-fold protein [Dehalococcoidia bacterium]
MPDTVTKPIPEPDEDSQPFFDGARAGKLMIMRCADCGAYRMPSRKHCDVCLSGNTEWVAASGRGSVRTFGVMHQKYHPGFFDELPYNLAVVELEEGPRLVTNLVDVENAAIRVDMPVVVTFTDYGDVSLPKFRPA